MNSSYFQSKTYLKLVDRLQKIFEEAKAATAKPNHLKAVHSYWRAGKAIFTHQIKLPYGSKEDYYEKICQDLKRKRTYLFEVQKLYCQFPNGIPTIPHLERLSWTHFTKILPIQNPKIQLYYLEQAAAENWNCQKLQKSIQENIYERCQTRKKGHPHGILKRDISPRFNFEAQIIRIIDGDTL